MQPRTYWRAWKIPLFFCKEAQAQTVCSRNANEPSGKSFKTKQTQKKRFAWLLIFFFFFCCCKACTCFFKTKSGGKALVSSECWYPITDTLPQSHVTVVYGRYPDFLKIHDVLLQRMESRFIPSVNLEQSAQTSDRKSHFYRFLLLPRLEAQSFTRFQKDHWQSLPLPTTWAQGSPWFCTGVIKDCLWRQWATRQLSSKRTLLSVMMTGKREQGLAIREITLYL